MTTTSARKATSKHIKPKMPPKINKISGAQYLTDIYKPLMIIMIVCGFNCGVTKVFVIKICLKIYSLFLIIVISYATMTCCEVEDVSFVWSLLEYSVFVTIMLFYRSKMAAYLNKLYLIDTYLRINHRHYYKCRNKQIAIILLIWVIRVTHTAIYCVAHRCYKSAELFYIYEFSLFALDVNRVWRYCHFHEIWKRLKLLRMRLEETPECNAYLYVKDNRMISENKVRFCFLLYRKIGELLDLISPELDASNTTTTTFTDVANGRFFTCKFQRELEY
ncbi:unnamed protein product [Chilo suppressalis]|uniref:Gustatory receptor n=1 Tax=Chilo suppressalis TaxID=168631 RepID=A0ABN8B1Z7_CHISP|nr:unnamed protein product [Chilo suppressalis]